MSCVGERNSNRAATLSLKGRVDFTCLNCFNQTHFASAVGHELVDPKRPMRSFMEKGFTGTAVRHTSIQLSILWKSECFKHARVVSVLTCRQCLIGTVAHLALCASAPTSFFLSCTVVVRLCHSQHHVTDSIRPLHGSRTKQRTSIHHISSTW